jgi:hypothetical protein
LPISVSHRSSVFLLPIFLAGFLPQLTTVLHAGSKVSYHNYRTICLHSN